MKFLQAGIASVMVVSLFGCSALTGKDNEIDYGDSGKRVPTLEVPPDLTAPTIDERYKVPMGDATYSDYSKGSAAQKNRVAAVLPELQSVHMERNDAQRWIVVNDKPENVWPTVKMFWQEIGLTISSEDQTAGVMETNWAENRAKIPQSSLRNLIGKILSKAYSIGERDQYAIRLERSKDKVSTEIYVKHRGLREELSADKSTSTWKVRPSDPENEAIIMQRLMMRLGASELQARNAVQATAEVRPVNVVQPGVASLRETTEGKTIIVMNDAFDRAWRKVGLAIEAENLTVEDKDREKGIYFLHSDKTEKNLSDRLQFWKNKDKEGEQYRVNVKDSDTFCEVTVTDQHGASNKTTKAILELIYKDINKQ